MSAFHGLLEVVFRAPDDDLLLEGDILVQNVAQGKDFRLGLVVRERQHVDGKGGLKLGLGKKAVFDHLGVRVPFQLDDNTHAVAVRLVSQSGNALQTLVVHLFGDVFDELALIDLIGQLPDDDAEPGVAVFLDLRARADAEPSPAGGIGGPDAGPAHNDAAGGKIGAFNVFHEVAALGLRIIQHTDAGV